MTRDALARGLAMMRTSVAEGLVAADPTAVFAAARSLATELWSLSCDDVLAATPGERLVHAVRVDGEVSCFLSWELSSVGPATTRVRLVHDEADLRDGPEPDLDGVLHALRVTLAVSSNR